LAKNTVNKIRERIRDMNIPLNLGMWLLAALPIIVLLVLMAGFQWGATKAAPIGFAIALVTGLFFYKADLFLVLIESLKGVWSTLVVLIVVWPAILLFEVVNEAKAFTVFRNGLQKYTPNELVQVIALGWVFMSFLQGITGFGVPVAVGAPLLVGIGVTPIWAVLIPLIGHAWANTFGTLAVAWDALVLQTNLAADPALLLQTAMWAASFIWVWNFITGIAISWIYGKKEGLIRGLPVVIVISLIQGGGQLLLSQVNQTLAAFIPAVLSLVAILLIGRTKMYGKPWRIENSKVMNRKNGDVAQDYPKNMSMHQAFLPYYVLTFITLFVLLIQPIKQFLGQIKFGFAFPETMTGFGYVNAATSSFSPFSPLTHAGMFLLLSSYIGYVFFRKHGWIQKEGGKAVFKRSMQKTLPSALAVLGFILMSRMMGGTGQTVILAQGFASTFGKSYAILAPVVGMLGAFMTSSNMASNILFGEFQLTTAKILSLNVAAILGAQTAGGAIGNTICPGNVILGTTTAGILGQEGIVLKKVLPITITAAVIVGMILFVTQVL
jgi:lactate permease